MKKLINDMNSYAKNSNLASRVSYVVDGEDGASNVEIVVWISVVLIIATVLYLFKDAIIGFLQRAINRVDNLGTGKNDADDSTYNNNGY
jgi:Flp pilus assembly pilin Flp